HGPTAIGHRAHVEGTVRHLGSLSLGSSVVISSGSSEGPVTPLVEVVVPGFDLPVNAANIMLEPNQASALAPGSYGSVTVKSGAKLKLLSGTYRLRQLFLEPNGTLELDSVCAP